MMVATSTGYLNYLRNIRAGSENSNPWFDQWYEQLFSCSLDFTNMRHYTEPCTNADSTPISDSASFESIFWFTNVINSVSLTAHALHETLKVFCGENYNGICPQFWNKEMGATFLKNFRNITFMDDQDNEIRVMNGQGKSHDFTQFIIILFGN